MKIRLKTVCQERLGALPDGEYEVPEGATAAEALRACQRRSALEPLPPEQEAALQFMVNARHARPDAVLKDGDRLLVLRPLTGG